MPQIQLTIPDTVMPRVLDAFAAQFGWTAQVPNPADPEGPKIANPESRPQLVKRKLQEYVKETVRAYEAAAATETAYRTASDKVANEITLS